MLTLLLCLVELLRLVLLSRRGFLFRLAFQDSLDLWLRLVLLGRRGFLFRFAFQDSLDLWLCLVFLSRFALLNRLCHREGVIWTKWKEC